MIFLFLPGSHAIYDYTPQSPVPQCNRDMQLFLALLESIDLVLNALHPNISALSDCRSRKLFLDIFIFTNITNTIHPSSLSYLIYIVGGFSPNWKNMLVNLCPISPIFGLKIIFKVPSPSYHPSTLQRPMHLRFVPGWEARSSPWLRTAVQPPRSLGGSSGWQPGRSV